MASISAPTWPLSPSRISFPPNRSFRFFRPPSVSSTDGEIEPELTSPGSDPLKLVHAKAEAYKNSKNASPVRATADDANGSGGPAPKAEVPASVKLALERAREYKKIKGAEPPTTVLIKNSGPEEIGTMNKKERFLTDKLNKKEEPKLSIIDFVGFEFSDKKRYRGPPPGLAPITEPLLDGEIPEVEIIVGDASKFGSAEPQGKSSIIDADDTDLYKPKVSTWGVFPRPNDISKTFGGGRVIQPDEVLETIEDKAAKEKRSRELIAAYKRKRGLTIDAKTKSECEKTLKEGDDLMDLGKLREALPYYEKVMQAVIFQSDLHGTAALQWSICQDSLRRSNEARSMYEKLQSHPNVQVSKKARQFVFSFQAMEMMKFTRSSLSRTTGYENYFDAFVEEKTNYKRGEEEANENLPGQALPYFMFLMSPILLVIFAAIRKSF